MTATDTAAQVTTEPARGGRLPQHARRWLPSWPATLLAIICYLPLLFTARGEVAADTKEYLYLDPGRMLSRAVSMWDPHIGMGTVTHQNIGYLWPMGPWYWVFDQLGVPTWVAQRLWTGSLLFFAGLGMLFLLRSFRWSAAAGFIAALTYALSPYVLEYEARTSAILLPFSGLPWLLGIAIRALRQASDRADGAAASSRWARLRSGWRWPAIFALVIVTVGSVNATSLLFAGLVPVLWVPWAIWGAREVHIRPALGVVWRTGLLTLLTSLWWIVGLSIQSGYGLDVLRYSETVQTVATTSHPVEVLRGLGNWYFYGRDRVDHWVQTSIGLLTFLPQMALSYFVPLLGIAAAAFVRWRHRAFFIAMVALGTAIAVGVYPYQHPSPGGSLFKDFAQGSTAGLALRSTGRAVPLVALGLAVLLAGGAHALGERLAGADLMRFRRRRQDAAPAAPAGSRGWARPALIIVVALLVIANLGPLWTGNFVDRGLQGAAPAPDYWKQAAKGLDAKGSTTRVLELPGQDFSFYRWGATADPVTPGLMDRPFVGREITPYGEPASAALIRAVDERLQEGTFETSSLPALSRLMGVGDVVLRSDLQYERFPQPQPTATWQLFDQPTTGLGTPTGYGPTVQETPVVPYTTEVTLGTPTGAKSPPAVADFPITASEPIVRAERASAPLLVDGDSDGLVDASSDGVLNSTGSVLFAASLSQSQLKSAFANGADVLVTDSNRRRAERWGILRDNFGYTEQAGEKPLVADSNDARLPVFSNNNDDTRTVTELRGVASVQASHYGTPLSYVPSDRPSNAIDGDLTTAWRVGAFADVRGERVKIDLGKPVTTGSVTLIQPLYGPRNRYLTSVGVKVNGGPEIPAQLGASSQTRAGQKVSFPATSVRTVEIVLHDTNFGVQATYTGASGVGFSEVKIGGRTLDETVRTPTDLLTGDQTNGHRLLLQFSRQRSDPAQPVSGDAEPYMSRGVTLPTARGFSLAGAARVSDKASDQLLDKVLGTSSSGPGGATFSSSVRLAGDLQSRASSAFDGNRATLWSTAFGQPTGQWVQADLGTARTVHSLNLAVVADGRHSVPTKLRLIVDGKATRQITLPPIADHPTANASTAVHVNFPAVTGKSFRVVLDDVRQEQTVDFFTHQPYNLPAAIAEVGLPGVAAKAAPANLDTGCRSDLLTIDGKPVAVRITGSSNTAAARQALTIHACAPLRLSAGSHLIRTTVGTGTGFDLDRLLLASDRDSKALTLTSSGTLPAGPNRWDDTPAMKVARTSATSYSVHVASATSPFRLVLGESLSPGWKATVNGHSLGAPTLVDGFANGWIVPAGNNLAIKLSWTPQHRVDIALLISALALLVCLLLAFWRRNASLAAPLRAGDSEIDLRQPAGGDRPPWRRTAIAVVLSGGFGALAVNPVVGLIAAVLTAAGALLARGRWILRIGAVIGYAAAAGYVLEVQWRYKLPADFQWVQSFNNVSIDLAWLAVVLLVGDVLATWARRGRDPADSSAAVGGPVMERQPATPPPQQ